MRQYFSVPQEILFMFILYVPFLLVRLYNLKSHISYRQLHMMILAFLFIIIMLTSNLKNVSEVYSLFVCLISFFVGSSLNKNGLLIIYKIIYLISGLASLLIFIDALFGVKILNIDFRFQYLPSSFIQSVFTIGSFGLIYFSNYKLLFKFVFIIALFSQFLNFGRGSILLSLIIIFINFFIINFYKKKYLKIFLVMFVTFISLSVFFQFLVNNGYINIRLMKLFAEASDEPRILVWRRFFDADFNIFFGGGMGFYKDIHSTHPHNLFLQLLEDSGIAGGITFMFVVLTALKRYLKYISKNDYIKISLFYFSVLLLYIATAQFSGNLYYNYGLFFFIGTAFVKQYKTIKYS